MLCTHCRFENREDVRFCEECGMELENGLRTIRSSSVNLPKRKNG